jgi:hypothetical protein
MLDSFLWFRGWSPPPIIAFAVKPGGGSLGKWAACKGSFHSPAQKGGAVFRGDLFCG